MSRKRVYEPDHYWQARGMKDCELATYSGITQPLTFILDHVNKEGLWNVLDIGAGWGRVYKFFKDHGYNWNYTMCDIVDSMIDKCEEHTGIRPDKWDGEQLPYRGASFDIALLVYVLQHTKDASKILAEAIRTSNQVAVLDARVIKGNARHSFHHDWHKLFDDCELTIANCQPFGDSMVWILQRE